MHSIEDVEYTIQAFKEVGKKLQAGDYQTETFVNVVQ